MSWLLLWACGGALAPVDPPPYEVQATVGAPKVGAGEPVSLTVTVHSSEGFVVTPGLPGAEGLSVSSWTQSDPVADGDRIRVVYEYSLSGADGSHVLQPGTALVVGPDGAETPLELAPVFVDIGVQGPSGGDLAGVIDAPPPEGPPWAWIAGGTAAALCLGGLLGFVWWRQRQPLPPPPPIPAHVRARQAWDQARGAQLEDHPLAVRLSMVFRAYLAETMDFPAQASTSREVLDALESRRMLDVAELLRARRILEATDRLKYAREGGGGGFFLSLDADFAAILLATRPLLSEVEPDA